MVQESANMIPDCERRLQDMWDELNNLLVQYEVVHLTFLQTYGICAAITVADC